MFHRHTHTAPGRRECHARSHQEGRRQKTPKHVGMDNGDPGVRTQCTREGASVAALATKDRPPFRLVG